MTAEIRTRAPAHFARRPPPRRAEIDVDDDDEPTGLYNALAWVALAVALLTLVVVAARSIAAGGDLVGDSALVAIRARDVLAGELPLVGAPAPTLGSAGAHHPAPLLYDVLALPEALFPGRTGLVVGVTLVNVVAVVVVFLVARRRGGPLLAILATLEALAVAWAVGSATFMGASAAGVVLLPFLAFVVLAWAVACGDVGLLPWAAGAGSFVVGTNLSYVLLVPVLFGSAMVAAYLVRRGRTVWLPLRTALATVVVLSAAWAQPLYEQLFGGPGDGNLARLGRAVRHLGETATLDSSAAVRVVGRIVALPPWWLRPSSSDVFRSLGFSDGLPVLWLAVVSVIGLAGELAVLLRDRHRTGDRAATVVLAAALVVMVVSLVTADLTPSVSTGLGERLSWLWPAGAFGAFAGVGAWLRFVLDRMPAWRTVAVGGATFMTVAFAGLTMLDLPPMGPKLGVRDETTEVAGDLREMLAGADLEGPLLVDCQETVVDPYCEAVMATLQRSGVAFMVPDTVHGLGQGRLWDDGDEVTLRLTVAVGGDQEVQPRADAMLLDVREGLSAAAQRELDALKDDLRDAVVDGGLELNERGRALADEGTFLGVDQDSHRLDAEAVMASRIELVGEHRRELVALVREDLLDVEGELAAQLERYADLQTTWDRHTVALFVQPM